MGVVYRARRARWTGRRPQAHERNHRRDCPPSLRTRVSIAVGVATPPLPGRLRLRRAWRRTVLHDGAVPGTAYHQHREPAASERLDRAALRFPHMTLAADYISRARHRPPRRSSRRTYWSGSATSRDGSAVTSRRQANGLRSGKVLRCQVVALRRGRVRWHRWLMLRTSSRSTLDEARLHAPIFGCLGLVAYEVLSGSLCVSRARDSAQ